MCARLKIMSGIEIAILVGEAGVSLFSIVLVFFSLVYYTATYIEERMKFIIKLLKVVSPVICVLSLVLGLGRFPWYVAACTFASNLMWYIIILSGFPFVNLVSFLFVLGIMATVFSHFFLMLHFLGEPANNFITISYFLFLVWLVPLIIIVSMSAVEDESQNDRSNEKDDQQVPQQPSKNLLKSLITRLLKKAEDQLPNPGNKFD